MASDQQLLAALNALYHQDDANIKQQAGAWLEKWQQSVEAWSVSDAVLHNPASNMEAQYFCALTLKTKVQRDFEELPASAVGSLRDSLLALLLKYAKGAPPVRTQLCLALVSLSAHLPAEHWGEGGVVQWFASKLQGLPADTALPCLLELLTVLPQEVNSFKTSVRPERRREHAQELKQTTMVALDILTRCLSQQGEHVRSQVLQAFGAWLYLSQGAALGPDGSSLPQHPLVVAALEGLQGSSDLFHASVDAVCELVWATVDPATRSINPGMMPLIQVLVPAVMALRPRFGVAARRLAAEHGQDEHDDFDDDEDTAKGMARLFAEVAEAYVALIATAVQEVQPPVQAMLDVAAYPDHAISCMSFRFWYRLSKALRSSFAPRQQSGWSSGPQQQGPEARDPAVVELERRRAFFMPAFERLVVTLRQRVRLRDDSDKWDREQGHEFKRQRNEVADTVEDACCVLGYSRCLALLVEPLSSLSSAIASGQAAFDWRTVDAVLFCIRATARHTREEAAGEPLQLLQLLQALPTMPPEPRLRHSVCLTIASCAEWVGRALSSGKVVGLLDALLQLAVESLEVPEAAHAAAIAVRDLCDWCGKHMLHCMGPLSQLFMRVLSGGAAAKANNAPAGPVGQQAGGQQAGASGLEEEDVQLVMHGVCVATCKCVPQEQLPAAAGSLLQPVLAMLQQVVSILPQLPQAQQQQQASLSSACPQLHPLMARVGVLFSTMSPQQCVADMLARAWPILDSVFQRCAPASTGTVEAGCRVVRLGIKGAGKAGVGLLPTMLEVLHARFRLSRHSAYLYIISELIKLFGDDPTHETALCSVLTALLLDACSQLETLQQVTASPELVDDTYLLAYRALSYAPRIIVTPSRALPALLDTALAGVLVQHKEACTSVITFIKYLLDPSILQTVPGAGQLLQDTFVPRAPLLVRLLLAGVVGALPNARVLDAANLLCCILKATTQQGLGWLVQALGLIPNDAVAPADKEVLLGSAAVVANRSGMGGEDRAFESSVEEFADLCRRNRRVRQAAQQALLPPELAGLATGPGL